MSDSSLMDSVQRKSNKNLKSSAKAGFAAQTDEKKVVYFIITWCCTERLNLIRRDKGQAGEPVWLAAGSSGLVVGERAAGRLTGTPKNGRLGSPADAAKLAPLNNPRLCIAAACRIGGLEAILIFSISASCSLFDFALLFWNHILTWVSVKLRLFENSARSAMERYCFSLNFFSSCISCWFVKGVRGFLFGLCFLRVHLIGPKAGLGGGPEIMERFWCVSRWFYRST